VNEPVSVNALSALSGLDRRRVKKDLGDLAPVKTEGATNLYELSAAITKLLAAADTRKDPPEIGNAKLRYLCAKAEREGLALGRERGETITINDAIAAWEQVVIEARQRILRLPATVAEIAQKLDAELCLILEDLSKADVDEITSRILQARKPAKSTEKK